MPTYIVPTEQIDAQVFNNQSKGLFTLLRFLRASAADGCIAPQ